MYHKLLQKQIRKYLPDNLLGQADCKAFLESINNSYESFERDRELMDHAFKLSEKEYTEVNQELDSLANQRLLTLKQLNQTISSLLGSDQALSENEDLVSLSEKIRGQVNINKLTKKQLFRNINLFKTLLANLQSGVLIENESREVLFTNDLFCSMFKMPATPDEMVGQDCSDSAMHCMNLFKDPERFVSRIETLLSEQKPVYNEMIETAEGEILERDYVPIFIDDIYRGHFWKYTNITESVHDRESLLESEERNRLVMNSSLDAIVIADDRGKVTFWNPRAEQMFGWTQEEAMGKSMSQLFIPDHMKTAHNEGMNRYLNTGVSHILNQELELTAVNKAGEEFPVELIVVTYQQNGKNYFCGFMRDISSRKKSENLLKAQEEKYRNIITNMNLGLLEIDNERKIVFANQNFCDISGYSEAELIGSSTNKFHLEEPNLKVLDQQLKLRSEGISNGYEIEVQNKSGEIRWWFISGAPNYNDKGTLTGSIGIHLDITEQKKLESELAIAKNKAEEASVAKEAFLANMSHEIRTPLNAIIGMIRELSREELSPKQQTYLSHTDNAARHLLSIVNNILDISKIEAGELKLEKHTFSLQALIANMVSILHFKAAKKDIVLTSALSEKIWPAYKGDSARIRQILINLLDNAIKFTMEGEVRLNIEVLQENDDEQVILIKIIDTGIGMDEEYMEQLFSKFSQAEKSTSRRFGGTGLGMSITKEIVKLMDGSIDVSSVKGQGTEFQITVSLKKGNIEELSDQTQDSQFLLQGTRVLLVEDNVMNRLIANKSLSHFGCTTDEAENGLIALELLKQNQYDIILMDIQMPELDGVETTKIIRNELKLSVPVIAVTANAFKKDIDLYLSIGMNDYVTKPFEEKELFNTIAKQLKWSAPASPQSAIAIDNHYDLTQLRALSRGDEEFVNNMIEIFLQHTPPALEEIEIALAKKDYATVARVAHKIKPSIESMGIKQLNGSAKEVELAAKAESVEHSTLSIKVDFLVNTLRVVLSKMKSDQG
ncbi:PAS domain S-box protein [Neolewinella aurantiaca]|uniref:histidine kinase n=1 Tax=Neolewinella aurantiaca TaxID=2602767 RepID=A0A5C7F7I7_9BACT|nr:PAS domain-containing hybrid sensor histidine kinase/response regulator [Neolewinella aurantiaca]TXF85973.1 PAS domain S-box protein [Neolewinella aurantiaca]